MHRLDMAGKLNGRGIPTDPLLLGMLWERMDGYVAGPPVFLQRLFFGGLSRLARLLGYKTRWTRGWPLVGLYFVGGDKKMREMFRTALYVNSVVAAYALVSAAHGASHAGHGVPFFPPQWAYVAPPLLAASLGAALVLRTRFRRVGAWLLLASMAFSLLFGVAYHFLLPGPDNVFSMHPGPWKAPFAATAALVAVASAVGVFAGLRALRAASRAPTGRRNPAPRGDTR